MAKANIIVVDDEPGVRDMLADALRMQGYAAASAADGHAALREIYEGNFDLIISDVNMPKVNGFELLERLRATGDETPVILLTARGDRADVAVGFRAGADDYVTKPFGLEELMLRVEARLKHLLKSSSQVLEIGPVRLDEDAHTVTVNGAAIELSPTEFRLLQELMQRKGRVATKGALLDSVWGINWDTNVTVLDTYISYLRKKVHTDTWQGIKTVRGIGFQIDAGE
ncbi:MAG: response regulator transcription factor [Rhodoluna sp.]|nr:response regulator transcription factor [Rhodoluna sp.]